MSGLNRLAFANEGDPRGIRPKGRTPEEVVDSYSLKSYLDEAEHGGLHRRDSDSFERSGRVGAAGGKVKRSWQEWAGKGALAGAAITALGLGLARLFKQPFGWAMGVGYLLNAAFSGAAAGVVLKHLISNPENGERSRAYPEPLPLPAQRKREEQPSWGPLPSQDEAINRALQEGEPTLPIPQY